MFKKSLHLNLYLKKASRMESECRANWKERVPSPSGGAIYSQVEAPYAQVFSAVSPEVNC